MSPDASDLEPGLEDWAAKDLKVLGDLGVSTRQLATALAAEIDAVCGVDSGGTRYAPDQFNISLNAEDASDLASLWDSLQTAVAEGLRAILLANGYRINRRLHISFGTDPRLERGGVQIIAWHSGDPLNIEEAEDVQLEAGPAEGRPEAFLVVEGKRIFRLVSERVAIGRRLDNDLVIDNPRVSRRHALIRASGGQYMIQDLQSTAGTLVNGRRVRSVALNPGDVIRLAETELVYGESPGEPPTKAAPYEGPPAETGGEKTDSPLATGHFDSPVTEKPPGPQKRESDRD